MLESIVHNMARKIGIVPYSPDSALWKLGLEQSNAPDEFERIFQETGYCFGVFRPALRSYQIPILQTNRSIVQIRDPRDVLVSLYFSVSRSHTRPPNNSELANRFDELRQSAQDCRIDEYAIESSEWISGCFYQMKPLFENPLCKVFRYEDIIFEKRTWTKDIASHFGWNKLSKKYLKDLAKKHDIRPKLEQPDAHIRSVTPGDHKRKLKPETIEQLNETFAPILAQFGYDYK